MRTERPPSRVGPEFRRGDVARLIEAQGARRGAGEAQAGPSSSRSIPDGIFAPRAGGHDPAAGGPAAPGLTRKPSDGEPAPRPEASVPRTPPPHRLDPVVQDAQEPGDIGDADPVSHDEGVAPSRDLDAGRDGNPDLDLDLGLEGVDLDFDAADFDTSLDPFGADLEAELNAILSGMPAPMAGPNPKPETEPVAEPVSGPAEPPAGPGRRTALDFHAAAAAPPDTTTAPDHNEPADDEPHWSDEAVIGDFGPPGSDPPAETDVSLDDRLAANVDELLDGDFDSIDALLGEPDGPALIDTRVAAPDDRSYATSEAAGEDYGLLDPTEFIAGIRGAPAASERHAQAEHHTEPEPDTEPEHDAEPRHRTRPALRAELEPPAEPQPRPELEFENRPAGSGETADPAAEVEPKPEPHEPAAVVRMLERLNYPLRKLSPGARTIVDWIALSLVFWVPIVWLIAMLVVGQ